MDKKIIADIYYDIVTKKFKAITEEGVDVTSNINNNNKLRYAYNNKRVIVGIHNGKKTQWKTKKTSIIKTKGYDWRTRDDIEEELQREINKKATIWYKKKLK